MLKTLKTVKNFNAEFAFEETMRLAGGLDKYSAHTQAAIWAECHKNKELQTLAGIYLIGSSERAERNLTRLRAEIYKTFLER
jgi:hypothetical protein